MGCGTKRGKDSIDKKSVKKVKSDKAEKMHSDDLGDERCQGKQMREVTPKQDGKGKATKIVTRATFEEDDQIFEIVTEGQNTDFASNNGIETENEGSTDGSVLNSGKVKQNNSEKFLAADDSNEISFRIQVNNNTTIADEEPANQSIEEGECSQFSDADERVVELNDGEVPPGNNDKLDVGFVDKRIDASMAKMQQFFENKFDNIIKVWDLERQLAENKRHLEELKAQGRNVIPNDNDESQSEMTIYRNVIEQKRGSSSSEDEFINSSDDRSDSFSPPECELQAKKRLEQSVIIPSEWDRQEAGGSKEVNIGLGEPQQTNRNLALDRSEVVLCEVEAAKGCIYDIKGKNNLFTVKMVEEGLQQLRENRNTLPLNVDTAMLQSVNDDYLLVASHIDKATQGKILNQEYVDFAKLLCRDRADDLDVSNQRMVMVNKGGLSYWVPMNDRQNVINLYNKWDQAFRVFLDIYMGRYPECTTELIQYSHIIQTASFSYSWENLYLYDREFCRHME